LSEHLTPVEVAVAFRRAWRGHDLEAAAGFLTCRRRLTVKVGKIQSDGVAFDAFAIRIANRSEAPR